MFAVYKKRKIKKLNARLLAGPSRLYKKRKIKKSHALSLSLLFCSFWLSACSDMLRSAPPATPGSGIPLQRNRPPIQQTSTQPTEAPREHDFGLVKCDDNKESIIAFEKNLQKFLGGFMDLGRQTWQGVKCVFTENWSQVLGGFFIRGKVYFENQTFLDPKSLSENLSVSKRSFMELHIVDKSNKAITTFGLNIDPLETQILSLSSILLVFKDDKGKILLEGAIKSKVAKPDQAKNNNPATNNNPQNNNNPNTNNNPQNNSNPAPEPMFEGIFRFENHSNWEGNQPGALRGTIGRFSIPACDLFNCKK